MNPWTLLGWLLVLGIGLPVAVIGLYATATLLRPTPGETTYSDPHPLIADDEGAP